MNGPAICSRRRLLIHTGALLGTTVGCASAATGAEPEAFGTVSAGSVADMSVGSLRPVEGAPAILGRDANGLYAMSSTCTHEGCDMIAEGQVDASGVYCACHGSRFNVNGGVTAGPATEPLTHFAVSIDMTGNITVEGGTKVGAGVRTAVV